jgi:hypothetical protein
MAEQWVTSPKPSAVLTMIDLEPKQRGDGGTVQLWNTSTGVIFARVVEPNGFVIWLKKVVGT